MDSTLVVKLIKSSTVMLDPLQKSILIGYFTNRDVYLNKLIPLLSVFMDQSQQTKKMLEQIHKKPREHWQPSEVQKLQQAAESSFSMARSIIKELGQIYEQGKGAPVSDIKNYRKLSMQGKASILVPDLNLVKKL